MLRLVMCVMLASLSGIAFGQVSSAEGEQVEPHGRGYFVFGGGLGSPAGVCVIGGFYTQPIVLRLSGGYWKRGWNGIQCDLGTSLSSGESFAAGISLVGGIYKADPLDENRVERRYSERYLGLAYDMYLAGFFLQAGLAAGKGDYPNPQAIVQFGYLIQIH